jgi:hypothetical protein
MAMLKLNGVMAAVQTTLIVCGGLACGGGSGSGRTGTGGTTSATGGTTATGTGGAGGGVGYPCTPALAPNANITDFADALPSGQWGTVPTLTGGTFSYRNAAGGDLTAAVDTTAQNFHMIGGVTGYAGGGLYFNLCTSAAAYSGVQFTIAGDKGTCVLELQVQTNSDKPLDTQGRKGTCTSGCVYPSAKALVVTGTAAQPIAVPFSSLTGGAPVPFDLREIVGLQWQLTSPTSCTADITIDDIVWTM